MLQNTWENVGPYELGDSNPLCCTSLGAAKDSNPHYCTSLGAAKCFKIHGKTWAPMSLEIPTLSAAPVWEQQNASKYMGKRGPL